MPPHPANLNNIGQGPTMLAVDVGGGLNVFSLACLHSLSLSLACEPLDDID